MLEIRQMSKPSKMYQWLDINQEARKRTLKLLPFLHKIQYYEKENKESLLENCLLVTHFSVSKWTKSVAKTVCDRFCNWFCSLHLGKLQINLRPIKSVIATNFGEPYAALGLVVCWFFYDQFFSRKCRILRLIFQSQICDHKIGCKIRHLHPKNQSQLLNTISFLPNIFSRKIGRKYNISQILNKKKKEKSESYEIHISYTWIQ